MSEMVEFRKRIKRLRLKIMNEMAWSERKVDLWFGDPNPAFGNISPLKVLLLNPKKCEKVINEMLYEESARRG